MFTRDASELFTCMKGDMYIMDVTHTKGHTHMLVSASVAVFFPRFWL